jgi:hypothetical protein
MAFYRLQYIKFILNFARLKNICKILTTYQGFCNLFSTAQNSAVWRGMSIEHSVTCQKVTQSHTEKVANNLKTRLFEFGSKI